MFFCPPKKDYDNTHATEDGTKPEGSSFACAHLKMVKIKCCMDDARVHLLAHLFMANGIPIENIYVHRTCRTCESYIFP